MEFTVTGVQFITFLTICVDLFTRSTAGITNAQRQEFLDIHNEKRRETNATDMRRMTWDSELETLAQNWAEQCVFDHRDSNTRTTSTFSSVGENLYVDSGPRDAGDSLTSWYKEVADYTYSTNSCASNKQCGHYTQVVWANSYKLGCGIAFCPTVAGFNWTDATVMVCNYGPAGNFNNLKPYTAQSGGALACSSCPNTQTACKNNMCASADCFAKVCQNSGTLNLDNCLCACTSHFTGASCETSVSGGSTEASTSTNVAPTSTSEPPTSSTDSQGSNQSQTTTQKGTGNVNKVPSLMLLLVSVAAFLATTT